MGETAPTLRPATRDDIPGVVALIGRVFGEYGFLYDPATEVPDLLAFPAHYGGPRGALWVVEHHHAIVGSVGVERVDARTAELHRLYVDPGLRRLGLGQALVETVQAWCRAGGIPHLTLWSDTRFDRAHALYERLGFVRTAERELPGDVNQTREYRYDLHLEATRGTLPASPRRGPSPAREG